MLLPLLVAIGAELKIFGPLVLPVFAGFSRPALLTLYALLAAEVDLCDCKTCLE